MKIDDVWPDNRCRSFRIRAETGEYVLPYAELRLKPSRANRVTEVCPDPELGREAFSYRLEDGSEDSVHMDAVLEYNRDPTLVTDLMLHRLTVEARRALDSSGLSVREVVRRLQTSASQLYRLLDTANTTKSVGQMIQLLHVLGRDVEFVVRPRRDV